MHQRWLKAMHGGSSVFGSAVYGGKYANFERKNPYEEAFWSSWKFSRIQNRPSADGNKGQVFRIQQKKEDFIRLKQGKVMESMKVGSAPWRERTCGTSVKHFRGYWNCRKRAQNNDKWGTRNSVIIIRSCRKVLIRLREATENVRSSERTSHFSYQNLSSTCALI